MGAYLNTPIREKDSDDKETETLRYGASSMQGWRMSQEDAHNCCPDFEPETTTSLFAVYDGHGGAEVAQYTAQKFPDFLKNYKLYKEGKLEQAMENAFLDFDEILTKDDVIRELRELAGVDEQPRGEDSDDEETERAMLVEEADMPIEKLMERYGAQPPKAGEMRVWRKKENIQSPVIRSKGEGLPFPGKKDTVAESEEGDPFDGEIKTRLESKLVNGHSEQKKTDDKDSAPSQSDNSRTDYIESNSVTKSEEPNQTNKESSELVSSSDDKVKEKSDLPSISSDACNEAKPAESKTAAEDCCSNNVESSSYKDSEAEADSSATVQPKSSNSADKEAESSGSSDNQPSGGSSSAAGSIGGSGSCAQAEEAGSSTGRTRSKRKGVIPEEGEDESSFDEDEETTDEEDDSEEEKWDSGADDDSEEDEVEMEGFPPKFNEDEDGEEEDEEEEPMEEFMGGGEEPGSDSGCTAVVALLRGRELVVANAGDSRCVVCRDGKAIDMSIDHKPEDAIELSRINKAGGCVTMDGRVNGGLNLSRAIGDHCYKQNTSLPLKEQMITSLPDIKCLTLEPTDEFMVLACDGIWNVMSSQDAVSFVRERIQSGIQKLSAICEEMFEVCLAPDTSGDGTGCDNMTCIIVSFDKLHRQLGDALPAQDGASGEEVPGGVKRRADSSGADSEGFDVPEAKRAKTEGEADSNSNSSTSSKQPADNGTD